MSHVLFIFILFLSSSQCSPTWVEELDKIWNIFEVMSTEQYVFRIFLFIQPIAIFQRYLKFLSRKWGYKAYGLLQSMVCNRSFFIQENFQTHQSGCFWPRPVSYTWKHPSNRRPLPPIIASRCAQQKTTKYSPKLQDWFGIVDWLPW